MPDPGSMSSMKKKLSYILYFYIKHTFLKTSFFNNSLLLTLKFFSATIKNYIIQGIKAYGKKRYRRMAAKYHLQ